MVLNLLSFSLMSVIDTLFVGRLGPVALASVGLGGIVAFTIVSFPLALFGAAKVPVGESFGRGDALSLRRALGSFVRLALFLGILCVFVGQFSAWGLPWLAADVESGQLAGSYTKLRSLSFPFVVGSAAFGQWLTAQGNSKAAMQAALIGNAVHVPLNGWFIFGLGWGVPGAALSTVLSQSIEFSVLALTLYLHQRERNVVASLRAIVHFDDSSLEHAWKLFVLGFPSGIERVLDMIAFSAVPILLSRAGALHVAAHQIVLQVTLLSFLPVVALGEAVSVLIAQALGARAFELPRRLALMGVGLSFGYAFVLGVFCVGLREGIVGLFTADPDVGIIASATLIWGAALQFINAGYNAIKGALRGFSDFRFVAWVTVGVAWIVTPPGTYWWGVHEGFGAPGAWATLCLEVTLGLLLLVVRLRQVFLRRPAGSLEKHAVPQLS